MEEVSVNTGAHFMLSFPLEDIWRAFLSAEVVLWLNA